MLLKWIFGTKEEETETEKLLKERISMGFTYNAKTGSIDIKDPKVEKRRKNNNTKRRKWIKENHIHSYNKTEQKWLLKWYDTHYYPEPTIEHNTHETNIIRVLLYTIRCLKITEKYSKINDKMLNAMAKNNDAAATILTNYLIQQGKYLPEDTAEVMKKAIAILNNMEQENDK